MGAIIVVDSFWGDSGKGKVAAYVTIRENSDLCIRAGIGTNAGHSVYKENGEMIKTRQLPLGFMREKTHLAIGSGVAVDPEILFAEIERYNLHGRVKVDYRCPIITPNHIQQEKNSNHLLSTIGSTASGSGRCQSDFVMRTAKQARDIDRLKDFVVYVAQIANDRAKKETIIIECSQGTYLSLALSPEYPYVTSGNCTVIAAADDVGLNWKNIQGAVMVVKSIPSRVGTGPLPDEISKEEILSRGIAEYGVVTGRLRRKTNSLPWEHLKYATMLNAPTEIALTFCDHYDPLS